MIRHNIHLYICYANKIILTVVSDPSVLYINHTNACMFMQKKTPQKPVTINLSSFLVKRQVTCFSFYLSLTTN